MDKSYNDPRTAKELEQEIKSNQEMLTLPLKEDEREYYQSQIKKLKRQINQIHENTN